MARKKVPAHTADVSASKSPQVGRQPSREKTPLAGGTRRGADERLSFRFNRMSDSDGWSPLKNKSFRQHLPEILKALKKYEGYTLADAEKADFMADYDMGECPNKTATKRLANSYDGADTLCRLEISGDKKARKLFGIREGSIISIIWYDAKHEVWPSGKVKR